MTRAEESRPLIIDTDAGSDDFLALAFLLSRPDVHIEAITIGTGLAHVCPGATNVLRFLQLAGRGDVPVYVGRAMPLAGGREFPAEWRRLSDELPGVDVPQAQRTPEQKRAVEFLAGRIADAQRPVTILALGGLTNIAEALAAADGAHAAVRELVIMGGAVHVPGNLADLGEAGNTTAEWNFYVDAEAARQVFTSGVPIRLIPLDATNDVPIDGSYVEALNDAPSPLAKAVVQLLAMAGTLVDEGKYYAWDPLAAVSLVEPGVVTTRPEHIRIELDPPDTGRSVAVTGAAPNAHVAFGADEDRFRELFLSALRRH